MVKNIRNDKLIALIEKEKLINGGFYVTFGLAALGMFFQILRGFDGMEPAWAISTGIEILALFTSVVVYCGFLHNRESDITVRTVFATLLISTSFSIFLDEIAWLVQGIARFSAINRLSNALLYINTYVVAFMFWSYLVSAFNMNDKATEITTRILIICFIPATVLVLINMFIPFHFVVDETGTYSRTALYPLSMIYYLIPVPVASRNIIISKEVWQEKVAGSTFYILPLLGIVLSFFLFGISISSVCSLVSILINYCVVISKREKKYAVTKNGLEIAADIQEGILPKTENAFPDRKDFEIAASMTPALDVGGDFYDFFLIDDDHLAILIADVSDKGIPAALFMTVSKVFMNTRIQMGGSPSEILAYVDERISAENEAGMFVTVWLGIIDLRTGHVEACNAGHDYPAISRTGEGYRVEKTPHGCPIAFLPGMPYPGISFDLKPGEGIFLYTDGLVEAQRRDGKRFGMDRMLEVLNANPDETCEQMLKKMKKEVDKFADGEQQFDDITMLGFVYKGR